MCLEAMYLSTRVKDTNECYLDSFCLDGNAYNTLSLPNPNPNSYANFYPTLTLNVTLNVTITLTGEWLLHRLSFTVIAQFLTAPAAMILYVPIEFAISIERLAGALIHDTAAVVAAAALYGCHFSGADCSELNRQRP